MITKEELIKDIRSLCDIIWDEYPINDPRYQYANEVMGSINKELEATSPQEEGTLL